MKTRNAYIIVILFMITSSVSCVKEAPFESGSYNTGMIVYTAYADSSSDT